MTATRPPALFLVKTADVQAAEVGQQITYAFNITNTGNVTITDPAVADTGVLAAAAAWIQRRHRMS